jgi:hypothetical protein
VGSGELTLTLPQPAANRLTSWWKPYENGSWPTLGAEFINNTEGFINNTYFNNYYTGLEPSWERGRQRRWLLCVP